MKESFSDENASYGSRRMSKKYIDADALLEEIEKIKKYDYFAETGNIFILLAHIDVAGAIKRQPAADVRENVRGEWIYKNYKTCCSKCFSPYGVRYDGENNFCPNCGADMRGNNL